MVIKQWIITNNLGQLWHIHCKLVNQVKHWAFVNLSFKKSEELNMKTILGTISSIEDV